MEHFTKMVEAYRWRGEDLSKLHHGSPTLTIPCKIGGQEQTDSMIERCSRSKGDKSRSLTPHSRPRHIKKRSAEQYHANHGVQHTQTSQHETKSCVSDDDGVVGNRQTLDRAISYSPAWYRPGQSRLLKNKSRAPSRKRSSRQLVFSIEDMDDKHCPKGSVTSEGKTKKETREKSRQTPSKQNGLIKDTIEDFEMPEFFADSTCEDGRTEFCSPDVSLSSELGNTPASRKRKRRISKPSNHLVSHVSAKGKSPFFVHGRKTPTTCHGKNMTKALSMMLSKPNIKTSTKKVYVRRRRKGGRVSPGDDVGMIESDEINGSSGLSSECVEGKDDEHQRVCSSTEALSGHPPSKAKTRSAYFSTAVKALGQRDIANKAWVPPISVHALIQEELYQDPWKVLVACMLLNKTAGKQTQRVIWDLFTLCPTPEAAIAMETDKVEAVIRPLGLQKKRARMIQRFSEDYLGEKWSNVGELHGIGKYATDAYAIFCEGRWQEVKPEDHKLVDYWRYLCATDGLGYAFRDNRLENKPMIRAFCSRFCFLSVFLQIHNQGKLS